MKQQIAGKQGWYDLVYINLKSTVTGYIKAGFDPEKALARAFDESTASKGIKHRIEREILIDQWSKSGCA